MSEKKLRQLGKRIVDEATYETIMGTACTYCGSGTERLADEIQHASDCLTGKMQEVLAADPDVVEVARELEKWEEEERALSDMVADSDSSVATAALNQSVAYHAARIKLQLRFGFHLTDDGGWEWVE